MFIYAIYEVAIKYVTEGL